MMNVRARLARANLRRRRVPGYYRGTNSTFQLAEILSVKYAAIGPVALHLPQRVETNDDLAKLFPKWDLDLIYSKTGIQKRHIAEPDECASDLGVAAAERLFTDYKVDRASIDFVLF